MEKISPDLGKELPIDRPYKQLERTINEIDKIRSIGDMVINFAVDSLNSLANDFNEQKQYGIERRIQTTTAALKNIDSSHSEFGIKLTAIRNQSLILLVSNFERFLNDLTIVLVEEYSYAINWPDQKLSIDFGSFQYGRPKLGEIVLASFRDKYNFQDLRSILDFVERIFGVKIELEKERMNKIVLLHAKRNILVHNLGLIDAKFLKQIRDTKYRLKYSIGDEISVSEKDYTEARDLILKLAKEIYSNVWEGMIPF